MNILLRMAERHIPVFVKRRELNKLIHLTASAFGCGVFSTAGLSYNECLAEYARFTKAAVDQTVKRGENLLNMQDRLFQGAFVYGKLWRKRFGVSNMSEVMRAGHVLYRAIGIEFRGTDLGSIEISKCFFSGYYSPATCSAISSIDAGIMAGLSGGETLIFSQKITEGSNICKARLSPKEIDT